MRLAHPQPDHRDLCIEQLLIDEADVIDLTIAYREIARAALDGLHDQYRRLVSQDRTIAHLREELRRYTAAQVAEQRAA